VAEASHSGADIAANVERMFQRAFALHGQGAHDDARAIYEQIFSAVPGHPGTLQMLAALAFYQGDAVQGEAYRDKALRNYRHAMAQIPPQQIPALMNLRAGLMNLLLSADETEAAAAEAKRLQLPLQPMFAQPQEWQRLRNQAIRNRRPRIVLNTIPKSASETVWNRLAKGLGMAQCHVSLGLFPNCMAVPGRVREFAKGGIVTKEHLAPTRFNVRSLTDAGIDRLVLHLRDPRQVLLSWAYFVRDDIAQTPLGPLWRQTCPPAAYLQGDFNALLDWCVDRYLPQVVAFIEGWAAIADDPDTPLSVRFSTFEHFLEAPEDHLRDILAFYEQPLDVMDTRADAADGHFRRGKRDEWRDALTAEQKARANAQLPAWILERFGWSR